MTAPRFPTLADYADALDLLRETPKQIAAVEAAKAAGVAFRPGGWCDVFALPDGRLGQVAVNGAEVTCYVEEAIEWVTIAPEGLGFCRCVVEDGLPLPDGVTSLHQGQSGQAWEVDVADALPHGLTFGVQPIALDPFDAYIVRSGYAYDEINLATGESRSMAIPPPVQGTSQGISDAPPGDSLWWADLHRSIVVHGVTLTYPNQRGGLLVGQCDPPLGIAGSLNGSAPRMLIPGYGFEPHLAWNGADRYAVCARTPIGAAWLTFTEAEWESFPLISHEQPPDPPDPPDPPIPPIDPPIDPPKPPILPQGDIMQFAQLDGAKAVPYIELKKSSQAGCVNVILPGGRVLSAHGDDRDPGTDGPWEMAQVQGGQATFTDGEKFYTYLIVPVDKLP